MKIRKLLGKSKLIRKTHARVLRELDIHRKFPSEVFIAMTAKCNANCIICSYNREVLQDVPIPTPGDIDKMDWLKHTNFIGLWCGVGEPLMNPRFEDILDLVNSKYPKAMTNLSTNGILLTPRIANKLNCVNISLNAASGVTWKKVTRAKGSFHDIVRVLEDCTETDLSISFIMHKDNLHELVDFVHLGAHLNATAVIGHCMFHCWAGSRPIDISKSCYNHQAETNLQLHRARQVAKRLNVTLQAPPLFGEPHYICRGTPVPNNMPFCTDPFKRFYLTVDELGNPSATVCCSGVYFDVPYDIHNMTTENFLKLWNAPIFKYLRKTTNKPLNGGNALCRWCKTTDRYTPEASQSYRKIVAVVKDGMI